MLTTSRSPSSRLTQFVFPNAHGNEMLNKDPTIYCYPTFIATSQATDPSESEVVNTSDNFDDALCNRLENQLYADMEIINEYDIYAPSQNFII
jgi:hypothetical protein